MSCSLQYVEYMQWTCGKTKAFTTLSHYMSSSCKSCLWVTKHKTFCPHFAQKQMQMTNEWYKTHRTSTHSLHIHKAVIWILTFTFHSAAWAALRFDHHTQCLPSVPLITAKVSGTIGWPHAKTWPVFPLRFTSKLPVFSAVNATQRQQRGVCVCVCRQPWENYICGF